MVYRNNFMEWSDQDLFWLVGIFETGGAFYKPNGYLKVSIRLQNPSVMARIARLLNASIYKNPRLEIVLSGSRARDFLLKLLPFFMLDRKREIEKLLDLQFVPLRVVDEKMVSRGSGENAERS